MPRSIHEWYDAGDGDDIYPAWRRMMCGEPGPDGAPPIRTPDPTRPPGAMGHDEWGAMLAFGPGDYHFKSGSPEVTRRVLVSGEGLINTRLYFWGRHGFVFRHRTSTITERPGNGAQGARLSDLALYTKGPMPADAHGILAEAVISLRDLHVQGFTGHGVSIDADVTRDDEYRDDPHHGTNANCCHLEKVRSYGNGLAGFFFKGGDSNQHHLEGCGAEQNGRYGYRDESYLGNVYIAPHASTNGDPADPETGDYWACRRSQRGLFLAPYEESPNVSGGSLRRTRIACPNIIIGGRILIDGLNPETRICSCTSDTATLVVGSLRARRPGSRASILLGPPDVDAPFEISHEAALTLKLLHRLKGAYKGHWILAPEGGNSNVPLAFRPGEVRVPGELRAAPKQATTDLAPPRYVDTMPAPAAALVGQVIHHIDAGDVETVWIGRDGGSGPYWAEVTRSI